VDLGKGHHGTHRRWILVMVPIDATNFDDSRRRRDVLGVYVYIIRFELSFRTMASGSI
jgi:hypothetical protein